MGKGGGGTHWSTPFNMEIFDLLPSSASSPTIRSTYWLQIWGLRCVPWKIVHVPSRLLSLGGIFWAMTILSWLHLLTHLHQIDEKLLFPENPFLSWRVCSVSSLEDENVQAFCHLEQEAVPPVLEDVCQCALSTPAPPVRSYKSNTRCWFSREPLQIPKWQMFTFNSFPSLHAIEWISLWKMVNE